MKDALTPLAFPRHLRVGVSLPERLQRAADGIATLCPVEAVLVALLPGADMLSEAQRATWPEGLQHDRLAGLPTCEAAAESRRSASGRAVVLDGKPLLVQATAPAGSGECLVAVTPQGDREPEVLGLLDALTAAAGHALAGSLLNAALVSAARQDPPAHPAGELGCLELRGGEFVRCDPQAANLIASLAIPGRLPGDAFHAVWQSALRGDARTTHLPLEEGGWLQVQPMLTESSLEIWLRRVAEVREVLEPRITRVWLLTGRELQVARLAAQGLGNAGIGFDLGISPDTVKLHLRNACKKLFVSGRAELAARLAADQALGADSGTA